MATVSDATLSKRVERAVAAAVAARRGEVEQLVRARLDAELSAIAGQLVAAELEASANGTAESAQVDAGATAVRLCSRCGEEPALPHRTIGRACKNASDWQRTKARRAARRRAATPASDDEELHPPGSVAQTR